MKKSLYPLFCVVAFALCGCPNSDSGQAGRVATNVLGAVINANAPTTAHSGSSARRNEVNPPMRMAEIPQPATRDAALEKDMLRVAKNEFWQDGRTPLKIILKSTDWSYKRQMGNIVDRHRSAFVIYRLTDGTHRLCDVSFKQLHQGGGKYGKLTRNGVGMTNREIIDYK